MDVREMRMRLGLTQNEFAERYQIPFRTVQNWETGQRTPPLYVMHLLERCVRRDLVNQRTVSLPKYDPHKRDLPKRSDYIGAVSWMKAVHSCMGEDVVFALDNALMCQGNFGGRSDEYLVWVYGDDRALQYNGVVLLGNSIGSHCVQEKNGLRFTDFNRTLSDSLANASILDMQGVTEAMSRYYYSNNESFRGLSVAPEYQESFEKLMDEAIHYYSD